MGGGRKNLKGTRLQVAGGMRKESIGGEQVEDRGGNNGFYTRGSKEPFGRGSGLGRGIAAAVNTGGKVRLPR